MMMKTTIASLVMGAALAAPLAANAAVIDVTVFEGGQVELATFDAPVGGGALTLAVGYTDGDPLTAQGGFEVLAGSTLALDGELFTLASTGNGSLEFMFDDLGGPAAGSFGTAALLTLDFGAGFAADPLLVFTDSGTYDANINLTSIPDVAPAPVPLPATGFLLFAALAGLAASHRRA